MTFPRGLEMQYEISKMEIASAGDAVFFPSWCTVHRGVPTSAGKEVKIQNFL